MSQHADSAQNVHIVEALLTAVNEHDFDQVTTLYGAEYKGLDLTRAHCENGPQSVAHALAVGLEAFPDLRFTSREVIVQLDRTVLFWTAQGTHCGILFGYPPTFRRVEIHGFSLLTIRHERIVRALHLWDMIRLLHMIKICPNAPLGSGRATSFLSQFLRLS
jgi:predicted ester cyclase